MTMEYCGVYKLYSFTIITPSGERVSWGRDPTGLLIYHQDGYMSVSINKEPEMQTTESETENWLNSILFYSGTYSIDGKQITHQVMNASSSSRIRKEMIRFAEWKEGKLHLITPIETFGQAELVWEKISVLKRSVSTKYRKS